MKHARRTLSNLSSLFAVALALSACGGGGGGETAPAPGTDPTAPAPAPTSPAPSPSAPAPAAVSGRLWHDDFALDNKDGTQIASLDGTPSRNVTYNSDEVDPWADGAQFATSKWDIVDGYTTVKSVDVASGNTVYSVDIPGYFHAMEPSPVDKAVVLGASADDTTSPADIVVVDMKNAKELLRFPDDGPVTWLPDGRVLHRKSDGSLVALNVPDGSEQPIGRLDVPNGQLLGRIWTNPQNTKLAVQVLYTDGAVNKSDLWISNADGSGMERFTSTGISDYARWSPDGNFIAFNADTGYTCTGAGCIGQCELWYAPVTSRNIRALSVAPDALRFTVKNSRGFDEVLGCDLRGWTQ